MHKAEFINIDEKKDSQRKAEMRMTPQERIERVFQLMDLAISMAPKNEIARGRRDYIPWIELRLKHDLT